MLQPTTMKVLYVAVKSEVIGLTPDIVGWD
jgi:hypothetical protein